MKQIILGVMLLDTSATAQDINLTQTGSVITLQNALISQITSKYMWANKSPCPVIRKYVDELLPLQKSSSEKLKPKPNDAAQLVTLSLANYSNESAIENIEKAYKILCDSKSGKYDQIFIDLHIELTDKDIHIAGFYLDSVNF